MLFKSIFTLDAQPFQLRSTDPDLHADLVVFNLLGTYKTIDRVLVNLKQLCNLRYGIKRLVKITQLRHPLSHLKTSMLIFPQPLRCAGRLHILLDKIGINGIANFC